MMITEEMQITHIIFKIKAIEFIINLIIYY